MNIFKQSYIINALLLVFVALVSVGGCGCPDCSDNIFGIEAPTPCSELTDFRIVHITNGANAQEANSFWSCTNDFDEEYELSIFADGTGESTEFGGPVFGESTEIGGPFFWRQTGCWNTSLAGTDGYGFGQWWSMSGSTDAGIFTYRQELMNRVTTATCGLVLIVL